MHAPSGMQSTFHFCDSETVLFIQKDEEFKHFGGDAVEYNGCRRVFRYLNFTFYPFLLRTTFKEIKINY